ncbi:uncharacterized protein MELLADRAFT_72928 [Melampsora larici-populina 98AG31]|uniref:F-box domain-containing protein n=1 Tax=Melampsora larici-populina (strain 98AG31 / pathotype 3-4-7) TaxID=747676 RepID=F4S0Z0_MELLP|nr:uncharacterized protein MELLADRAFT_72928 [Melampsora larici-populina 98AG31]EGG01728.1 hypothetical protein MELLADRAFT_72928 [Melampsora larici-populina 98AG31]
MIAIGRLPFEIIVQILREFVNQSEKNLDHYESAAREPYLRRSSYTELIKLRLVSKMWSNAVIPFYFETISIDNSKYANLILDNWNDGFFGSNFHCPVKRLTIGRLSLPKEVVQEEEEVDCKKWKEDAAERANLVTVNQVARLIELLGINLKTLNITFFCSMGVSHELVEACKTIRELKSISILFDCIDVDNEPINVDTGPIDVDSISRLLSALPRIESLYFGINCVEPMSLEPPALQNLRHYSFMLEWVCLEGICHIIQTSKTTLKIIELLSGSEPTEGVERVFEPIKDTLEGLFTSTSADQIIEHVTEWDFPNLRVIRTHYPPEEVETEIYWLQDPILKNVRTIVTDLDCSEEYWIVALELAGVDALKGAPNFKHIVFTKSEHSKSQEIDPELVKAFKSHGVQCHFSHELTPDECMELDYQLNGPM